MEGCREEKKFCGFEQRLALKKNIYSTFDGRKSIAHAIFFPPKDLVYISINTRLDSRAQTFFFLWATIHTQKNQKNFPPKVLAFLTLSKTETKTETNKHIPFFPADGLSFVYANYKLLSKAHSVSNRKLAFAFSS